MLGILGILSLSLFWSLYSSSPFDRRHHPRYCNTSYNWSGMNLQGFRCDLDFSCGEKDERTKEGVPTGPRGPRNSDFLFE